MLGIDFLLLGDLAISLSAILPFLLLMRLIKRLGGATGLKTRWWIFPVGLIGLLAHAATIIAERLGYIPPGPLTIYYSTLSRAVISVTAALGMTNILVQSGVPTHQAAKFYITITALTPAIALAIHRSIGHTPIIQEPFPTQTLYQGFVFWFILSYSATLLSRFEKFIGVGSGLLSLFSSLLYALVSFLYLYVASNYLYGVFTLEEFSIWRGVAPLMGVVAGAAALYASLNITVREMPSRARPAQLDLIRTGVAWIDRELGGGIPFPSNILIMGPSGSGKTSIINRILCRSLEEDISVAQLCLDYDARSVRRLAGTSGIRCEEYESQNKLILVEGYIQLAGITPKERFTTTRDLTDLSINITSALNQLQGYKKLLQIDS
ncbi:MAG: ATPase domain-containing protein [Nitrososphaerota archaeon]